MEMLAVSATAFMLLKNQNESLMIGVIAGLTFLVLDYFVPAVSDIARTGVGLGFGLMMVGGSDSPYVQSTPKYKMIPTCPDPDNSGKALLASYNEGVAPGNVSDYTSWPFSASQTIKYGSCETKRSKQVK